MYLRVSANVGFNTDAVSYWFYEPPLATPQAREEAISASITPRVPGPEPVMTIHFIGGGLLELHAGDADKVRNYYGIPSSSISTL